MKHKVTSRFSISSPERLDAEWLAEHFTWLVTEKHVADDKIRENITIFDLGIGSHDRVDHHLAAAKTVLLDKDKELSDLAEECGYALWIGYFFPAQDGAINITVSLQRAFGYLGIELIFHLKPTE